MRTLISVVLLIAVFEGGDTADRCDGPRYNCANRNPCTAPACDSTRTTYPGRAPRVYVQCGADGSCSEPKCPRRQIYSESAEPCVRKTLWGEYTGFGDSSIYADSSQGRCGYSRYDCRDRNPCDPELCISGQQGYAGPTPSRYVSCATGTCEELTCSGDNIWKNDAQECRPEQEDICFVEHPGGGDPCTSIYSSSGNFLHKTFVAMNPLTRGFTITDPEFDCMNSNGAYFTKVPKEWRYSDIHWSGCYRPGGLCHLLDSNISNYDLRRSIPNSEGEPEWRYVEHPDGTVPADCVEHDIIPEADGNPVECRRLGGTIMLHLDATSFGKCDELPLCEDNLCAFAQCTQKGICPQ